MTRVVQNERGFTLIELVVTVSLMSLLSVMAIYQLHALENELDDSTTHVMALVKKTRGKALATTYAYTLRPTSASTITGSYGDNCSDTAPVVDPKLTYELPSTVTLMDTSWSICFSARGLADNQVDIELTDGAVQRTIQVALGGGLKLL